MKKKLGSLKGFTLLELIIVIAVISILLMIIVPNMTGYMRSNRMRAANDKAQQVYMATQDYLNSLQIRNIDLEQYFGPKDTNGICYLGAEYSVGKAHTCSATDCDNEFICKRDIRLIGADNSTLITVYGAKENQCKPLEAVRSIQKNLSGDFEGAWIVEIYPATYTVRVALYSEQPNDCTDARCINSKYDWDAVHAVAWPSAPHLYESQFASGVEGVNSVTIHARDMGWSKSQNTSYDKSAKSAYVGQYPMPVT